MRVFASYKAIWLVFFLILLPFSGVRADCCSAQINYAEFTRQGNSYRLSADILYQFSEKAREALQNGVPLFWDIRIKIQEPRQFFWPKTLAEKVIRYRLQYHALLNMYRVKNESTGEVTNVSSLSVALNLMSILRDFHILDNADFLPTPTTGLALKVEFDRSALPLPLRPMAYLNRQWYLSSDWTLWTLKN